MLCRCCSCFSVALSAFLDALTDLTPVSETIFFSEFLKKINSDVKLSTDFNFTAYFTIVDFDLPPDISHHFGKCFAAKLV